MALQAIGPETQTAVAALAKALEDPEPAVRTTALNGLTEFGSAAVDALSKALDNPKTRYWAALAVGELGPSDKGSVEGVRGALKGFQTKCLVDYVQNEENVEVGELFYTSGDDRIFPKGFPVGQVTAVRNGKTFKEIYVVPSGLQGGVEAVLVILEGVHQPIPEETASPGYKILATRS